MSDDILDISFTLTGRAVAADYADALSRQVCGRLPWLADEPAAGIHPLHRVGLGTGELTLSRHSRLILRLPRGRLAAAGALTGARLELGGEVAVGAVKPRELAPAKVLYSSFVSVGQDYEDAFLDVCGRLIAGMGISVPLLCGKARRGAGGDAVWSGFSLMLHGLGEADSLRVQREGLGGERKRGCGIFVPHRSVVAVGQ
ncbi:MAG: type I-MYXAN CRISPR-associated protein Cas6/Cmx6 [Rhodocyclaceae bacterium]|nr:type I-MYXAN CRISPR-associated protein Cas6/Cmx6 [Rhodocyclaceae bacterium]